MIRGRNGNTLITVLIFAVLAFLGLAFTLSKINFFNRTVAESEMNANLSEADTLRFWVLQKKFFTSVDSAGNVKLPDWYPDPYPVPSEMEKTSQFLPRLANIALGSEAARVGTVFVRVKRDPETNTCPSLSAPYCKKPPASEVDCDALDFNVDGVGLGALEGASDLSSTGGVQNACLAVPSFGLLTPAQKDAVFSPAFNLPLDTALESVAVSFKKYIADDSSRPNSLTKMVVTVGSTSGIIPIAPPPPPKTCSLVLKSPVEPIDVSVSSQNLKFDLLVDGLAETVELVATGSDSPKFQSSDFNRQSLKDYGQLKLLKSTGFDMMLSSMTGEEINPANPQEYLRTVTAIVYGFSGSPATCERKVRIKKISVPVSVSSATCSKFTARWSDTTHGKCDWTVTGTGVEKVLIPSGTQTFQGVGYNGTINCSPWDATYGDLTFDAKVVGSDGIPVPCPRQILKCNRQVFQVVRGAALLDGRSYAIPGTYPAKATITVNADGILHREKGKLYRHWLFIDSRTNASSGLRGVSIGPNKAEINAARFLGVVMSVGNTPNFSRYYSNQPTQIKKETPLLSGDVLVTYWGASSSRDGAGPGLGVFIANCTNGPPAAAPQAAKGSKGDGSNGYFYYDDTYIKSTMSAIRGP